MGRWPRPEGVAAVRAVSKWPVGEELLAAAVNGYISLDPELKHGLAELAGKRIKIALKGTGLVFQLAFEVGGVRFVAGGEDPADIMVDVTPIALLRLLTTIGEADGLLRSEIAVRGEVTDAQRIRSLLGRRQVDGEELLAKMFGDVAARQIGNLVRSLMNAGERTTESLLQDFGEYLTQESRLTPARAELDAMTSDVDSLRDDAERLHKRILRLQQRSSSEQGA